MATMSFRQDELEILHKCLILARQIALSKCKRGDLELQDYVRLDAQIGNLVDRIWEVLH